MCQMHLRELWLFLISDMLQILWYSQTWKLGINHAFLTLLAVVTYWNYKSLLRYTPPPLTLINSSDPFHPLVHEFTDKILLLPVRPLKWSSDSLVLCVTAEKMQFDFIPPNQTCLGHVPWAGLNIHLACRRRRLHSSPLFSSPLGSW